MARRKKERDVFDFVDAGTKISRAASLDSIARSREQERSDRERHREWVRDQQAQAQAERDAHQRWRSEFEQAKAMLRVTCPGCGEGVLWSDRRCRKCGEDRQAAEEQLVQVRMGLELAARLLEGWPEFAATAIDAAPAMLKAYVSGRSAYVELRLPSRMERHSALRELETEAAGRLRAAKDSMASAAQHALAAQSRAQAARYSIWTAATGGAAAVLALVGVLYASVSDADAFWYGVGGATVGAMAGQVLAFLIGAFGDAVPTTEDERDAINASLGRARRLGAPVGDVPDLTVESLSEEGVQAICSAAQGAASACSAAEEFPKLNAAERAERQALVDEFGAAWPRSPAERAQRDARIVPPTAAGPSRERGGEDSTENESKRLVICPSCGTKNRLLPPREGRQAACGRCRSPLLDGSGQVPTPEARFSAEGERSPKPVQPADEDARDPPWPQRGQQLLGLIRRELLRVGQLEDIDMTGDEELADVGVDDWGLWLQLGTRQVVAVWFTEATKGKVTVVLGFYSENEQRDKAYRSARNDLLRNYGRDLAEGWTLTEADWTKLGVECRKRVSLANLMDDEFRRGLADAASLLAVRALSVLDDAVG